MNMQQRAQTHCRRTAIMFQTEVSACPGGIHMLNQCETNLPHISHLLCVVPADLLGLGLEEDPGPEVLTGGAGWVL